MAAKNPRQLALNVFFMRFGHHPAAWRSPGVTATDRPDIRYWVDMAKLAEQAKFDAFFMADHLAVLNMPMAALKRSATVTSFDPMALLPALAM